MQSQEKNWIYLADQRVFYTQGSLGYCQIDVEKSLQLSEYSLNEDSQGYLPITAQCCHLILPILGGLEINHQDSESGFLVAGQALFMSRDADTLLTMKNPFKETCVQFLHLRLNRSNIDQQAIEKENVSTYQVRKEGLVDTEMVRIFEAATSLPFLLWTWQFYGREEKTYIPTESGRSSVCIYVVSGAFECQGRLLHARDVLKLEQADRIDIEALSEDALLFLIEY